MCVGLLTSLVNVHLRATHILFTLTLYVLWDMAFCSVKPIVRRRKNVVGDFEKDSKHVDRYKCNIIDIIIAVTTEILRGEFCQDDEHRAAASIRRENGCGGGGGGGNESRRRNSGRQRNALRRNNVSLDACPPWIMRTNNNNNYCYYYYYYCASLLLHKICDSDDKDGAVHF